MISLETKGIFIGVETEFLPQQSDSMQFNFVFMYTNLIENKSLSEPCRIIICGSLHLARDVRHFNK